MRLGRVYLVGAGPGDPGLLTVRGRDVLRLADVVVYDRLVNPVLLDEAPPRARRIFAGKQPGDHPLEQGAINALLVTHAWRGDVVVRLKGGDPFVFGRGGEEAEALSAAGIPFEVVPGVTSAVAVPAYAGIPVTQRGCSSSFAVVTGHERCGPEGERVNWSGLATAVDTLVILMPVRNLRTIATRLLAAGREPATPIALIRWGTVDAQDTLVSTLGEAAAGAPLEMPPPVVAVVGRVVELRERLRWFDRFPEPGSPPRLETAAR